MSDDEYKKLNESIHRLAERLPWIAVAIVLFATTIFILMAYFNLMM